MHLMKNFFKKTIDVISSVFAFLTIFAGKIYNILPKMSIKCNAIETIRKVHEIFFQLFKQGRYSV